MQEDEQTPIPVELRIDPLGLRRMISRHITLTYQRVAVGINRCAESSREDAVLRDVPAQLSWAEEAYPNDEWIRSDMRTWLLANGWRELIETVTLFLDHLHVFFLRLELGTREAPVKREELDRYQKRQATFHSAPLSKKLTKLAASGYVTLPDHIQDWIESLNAARRCLVHRGGRVGPQDLDDSGKLRVTWRSQRIVLTDSKGTRELGPLPHHVPERTKVGLRFTNTAKEFKLGEVVEFTAEEFAEIAFGLDMFFVIPVMKQVGEALRAAGMVAEDGTIVGPQR